LERGSINRFWDVLFGVLVGLSVSVPVGLATAVLGGFYEARWWGALLGAGLGSLAGGLVGAWRRKRCIDLARWDIATILCIPFGMAPAFFLFFASGVTGGRYYRELLIETALIGFIGGLAVGAIFDRGREASFAGARVRALVCWAVALAGCLGLALVAPQLPYGPAPAHMFKELRHGLYGEWADDPIWKKADIEDLKLARSPGERYTGTMRVQVAGERLQYRVEVILRDHHGPDPRFAWVLVRE
jgi:hypothetical protein